jgi:CYTH domain-containing protein
MSQKYARLEIERRWLVSGDVQQLIAAAPFSNIEDHYLTGTRLRLRAVSSPEAPAQWKLCKKYPKTAGQVFEFVTNIYLSESEFNVLARLPCSVVRKRRYRLAVGSLDVYTSAEPAVFEREFETEDQACSFVPPSFVGREITGEESLSGAALAGAAT